MIQATLYSDPSTFRSSKNWREIIYCLYISAPSLGESGLVYSLKVWISRRMFTVRLWSYGVLESLKITNENLGEKLTVGMGQ